MIALIAGAGVLVALALTLLRLAVGPTLHDRALAVKTLIVQAALVCAAFAVAGGQSVWLDVALALMFAVLVLVVAVLKVFRARTFQAPLAAEER